MPITVQLSQSQIKRDRRLSGKRKATANQRQRRESLTTKVALMFGLKADPKHTQPPAKSGA